MPYDGSQMMEIDDRGIGSFIASNMDEIDDSVLLFGAPKGLNSMRDVAERMANMGRGGDNYIVHASEREVMVPREVAEKNPEMMARINAAIAEEGADPEAYVVGSDRNSINPQTGQREFFLKKLVGGIKKAVKGVVKVFKKIAPIILPFAINTIFPGLGTVFSGALGSGLGSLAQGNSLKDSMKAAVLGGGIAALGQGFSNMGSGKGGFSKGFTDAFKTGGPSGNMGLFEPKKDLKFKDFFENPFAQDGAVAPTDKVADGSNLFTKARQTVLPTKAELIAKNFAKLDGTTLTGEALKAAQKAAANPGLIQRFGPAAALGTGVAVAAGAFDAPEGTELPFEPYPELTEEEIDAVRVGVAERYPEIGVNESIVPSSTVPGFNSGAIMPQMTESVPRNLYPQYSQQGSSSNYLPQIVAPSLPNISPPQINAENSGVFGYDRFGNPITSVYAAANGGGIQNFPRRTGGISGPGTGTSDSVPAMLSDGEFVMTADAVRGAGNGSRQRGMQNMYSMMRRFEGGAV
jgi:hypothetical protein